ncbi:MAG: hypothetical protein IJW50_06365 [Clostridia bacterium]|nr:hypothetical protein [Clostridia bacterium]
MGVTGVVFSALSFMNLLGNNKGLNFNMSRKWYLPSYFGINKNEPRGYNDIWSVYEDFKKVAMKIASKIVKLIGEKELSKFTKKPVEIGH